MGGGEKGRKEEREGGKEEKKNKGRKKDRKEERQVSEDRIICSCSNFLVRRVHERKKIRHITTVE